MTWQASKTTWAAFLAMTILRSARAGWRAERLQVLNLLGPDEPPHGQMKGAIPDMVGAWSKMTHLKMRFQVLLSGSIPQAIGSMTTLQVFDLSGPGVAWLLSAHSFGHRTGSIPHAVGSMTNLVYLSLGRNSLRGPIPVACGFLAGLEYLELFGNSLRGTVPADVGSLLGLRILNLGRNSLDGPLPDDIGSLLRLLAVDLSLNSLHGPIPHVVGSLLNLWNLDLYDNSLRGCIPDAVGCLLYLSDLALRHNSLRGPIPDAVGSLRKLRIFLLEYNSLSGLIPDVVGSLSGLFSLDLGCNSLRGRIPDAVGNLLYLSIFKAFDNELSGSMPSGLFMLRGGDSFISVHCNRLEGTLQTLESVEGMTASHNFLEGGLPNIVSSHLIVLDVSGVVGRSRGLIRQLPPALRQLPELRILTLANQQICGSIPSFRSTLSLLALHNNCLRVLSDVNFEDNPTTTTILLHNNLLSCYVPMCGNATAKTSLIAIGNQFRYPNGEFPAWVMEYERDPLLWIAGTDGMSLVQKLSGAAGLFMFVVVLKLGIATPLRVMSGWPIGPAPHLWVVKASSHLHTCMTTDSAVAAVFIVFLLSWDFYGCPQTLALLSACSRSRSLIRTLVFLCWCKLCFHALAVEHLTMEHEKQKKKWTSKILRKRLLLWLVWCVLTAVLSTLATLHQVAQSIPGTLQDRKILSLALKACIGATQAVLSNFIMPYLADKISSQKHVFTTVSALLMNCVIPAVVIIYLDTGCLGRWVSLWKKCRSNSQLFQRRLICSTGVEEDCRLLASRQSGHGQSGFDFVIIHASDICDPHVSWTLTSMSGCIHIVLIRLQEVWLAKFITTGLVMPGVNFMRNKLPTESSEVVGNFGIYMAYALVSSGHLPLMNFILFLAFLGEGLVARVAWVEKRFKAKYVEAVAGPVVKMARLLSFMVHVAAAAGDPHTLVFASAYMFMRIMARCIGMRLAAA